MTEAAAVVFGGCGFLGKRLVELLKERGGYRYIYVFDRVAGTANGECLSSGIGDFAEKMVGEGSDIKTEKVVYERGDLTDAKCVHGFLKKCAEDVQNNPNMTSKNIRIFHVASPHPNKSSHKLLHDVNVNGTKIVCEGAKLIKAEALIFCSTCSVVFEGTHLLDACETFPIRPQKLDPYSQTKAEAEQIVRQTHEEGVRTLSLRPHMIFGPHDNGAIAGFIEVMKKGSSRFMIGDGSALASPTYVDNVAWAHVLGVERLCGDSSVGGESYNITNDRDVGFWAFFSFFCGEFGYERPRYRIPYPIMWVLSYLLSWFVPASSLSPRKVELAGRHHTFSCEKARQRLGYEPLTKLIDGMKTTVALTLASDLSIKTQFDSARAICKAFKKKGGQAVDSVPTDLRFIALSWTLYRLAIILSISCLLQFIHKIRSSTLPLTLPWAYATFFFTLVAVILHISASQGSVFGMNSSLPLVGDFLQILDGPTVPCQKIARRNFDCYSLSFVGKPIVFVTGKDGHEFFFKATDDEISLKEVYKVACELFGKDVLYGVDADTRQQQFHHLSQGLTEKNMRSYIPHFVKECTDFFGEWKEQGNRENLNSDLAELITFTACRCLLGREIRESFYTECKKLLETMDEGITPISLGFPNFPIPAHRKRDSARESLKQIFAKVIKKRRECGQTRDSTGEHDMLSNLMEGSYNDGRHFTDEEITGFLIALMFGGQHTSSVTCAWAMINLLCRAKPDFVKKVLEEQRCMQENGGITFDNINNKTEYLGALLTESLRLSNPLAILLRYVTKRRFFKGYSFGPGTILAVCSNESGLNPDIYETPNEFRPERWLQENWDDWRQEYKYVAFGAGRHTCMGRRFAFTQIKTILSYILQNFAVQRMSEELPDRNYKSMIIGPDRSFPIKYRKVSSIDEVEKSWKHILVH